MINHLKLLNPTFLKKSCEIIEQSVNAYSVLFMLNIVLILLYLHFPIDNEFQYECKFCYFTINLITD